MRIISLLRIALTAATATSAALVPAEAGSLIKSLVWWKDAQVVVPTTRFAECGRRAIEKTGGVHIVADDLEADKPGFSFDLQSTALPSGGGEVLALRPGFVRVRVTLPDSPSSDMKDSADAVLRSISNSLLRECRASVAAP